MTKLNRQELPGIIGMIALAVVLGLVFGTCMNYLGVTP